MSRSLTNAVKLALEKNAGQDPFFVVKLTLGTHVYWFGDRVQTQDGIYLDGRLQSVGAVTTSVKVDRSNRCAGTVSVCEFTLLDDDKSLLALVDANNFQGARVQVYYWFTGHVQADMVLLLNGRIEKAPVWTEKDRTLHLVAETPRRINPIPFSPSESDGLDVDESFLGQVWPMCFGTPSDVPAVQVKASPRGTLIQDMTQDGIIEDQTVAGIPNVAVPVETNVFEIDNPNEDFPQDVACLVKVADEYMLGSFDGNTLTVTQRQVNHYTAVPVSGTGAIVTVPQGVRAAGQYIIIRGSTTSNYHPTLGPDIVGIGDTGDVAWANVGDSSFVGYCYKQVGTSCYIWNGNPNFEILNSVADINRYPNLAADGAQWVHKAGSPVVVASVTPVWIANSITSDSVVRVRAWRQVTKDDHSGFSRRELVVVPRAFYTVNLNHPDYNGATTIAFTEDLSVRESGWEDQPFVTVESSVGSNTADVIRYLIDNHSEGSLTADPVTFNAVADAIDKYPSHFAIQRQADLLDLVGEIAWQARCGVCWNGAQAQIVYLSKEPTAGVMQFNDYTVAEGSVLFETTRIEDVVTVLNAEWRANYSDMKPRTLMYRTNVARYGKREQRYQFWIYQARKCVVKSASFWAGRLGRIWRTASVENWSLEGMAADSLDYAAWRIDEFLSPVFGLVEQCALQDDTTSMLALLPIEAGTVTKSSHFWVSDSGDTAPAARDLSAGSDASWAEVVQAPPPQVVGISAPEQTVFHVVANADENIHPEQTGWKTVEVRILDAKETEARNGKRDNEQQIAQIDALDPDHLNSSLQTQRQGLVDATLDLTAYITTFTDHPELVTARNPSATYMKTGDEGTMIKIPGGEYIVTPANAQGPFIVRISKKRASPAEGTIYGDIQGSIPAGPSGTQEIELLGDADPNIDDLVLVFRDATGKYFTAGNNPSSITGVATCQSNHLGNDDVPLIVYYTGSTTEGGGEAVLAFAPAVDDTATIPAGTWGIAVKINGTWFFMPPVYTDFVE